MPLQQTSGNATSDSYGGGTAVILNYIEDVFSTYLYTGNGSTQTINNGIDLAGKGGLVWMKNRSAAYNNSLCDTVRGNNNNLSSNSTGSAGTLSDFWSSTSSGFSVSSTGDNYNNGSGYNYASWTFRKQPKFFDVVTYTGNGANRTISHNLGSTPGCIIVKRTDTTGNWQVYHNSLTSAAYSIQLNLTNAQASATTVWNSTAPTSSVFSLGTDATVNANAGTYVAYLFAHNAGGFGLSGTDNVISCGSFTTDASGNATVNLGWEPQFVLIKSTSFVDSWYLIDVMRGMSQTTTNTLRPNTSGAESAYSSGYLAPTATGFTTPAAGLFTASQSFIYIAIRRPMNVPTSGTSVFSPPTFATGSMAARTVTTGFVTDLNISRMRANFSSPSILGAAFVDRLRGPSAFLVSDSTGSELTQSDGFTSFASNTGYTLGGDSTRQYWNYDNNYAPWSFKRAPGFFDVVCYTGDGTTNRQITHNLGVSPELVIVKSRTGLDDWEVLWSGNTVNNLVLNTTAANNGYAYINGVGVSYFQVANNSSQVNYLSHTYVAYLFATCANVSKIGSYTGNGSSQTINCGFTSGARFILIKRTNSTGDWYVWDSARGIVASNDPHLSLNTTAAEVTTDDSVDVDSSGFIVNQVSATNVNVTSATYIFLAVA